MSPIAALPPEIAKYQEAPGCTTETPVLCCSDVYADHGPVENQETPKKHSGMGERGWETCQGEGTGTHVKVRDFKGNDERQKDY